MVPKARPVVEKLVANGMYMSPATLKRALALVGE
jgi:predicted nucleic acid-binding protein